MKLVYLSQPIDTAVKYKLALHALEWVDLVVKETGADFYYSLENVRPTEAVVVELAYRNLKRAAVLVVDLSNVNASAFCSNCLIEIGMAVAWGIPVYGYVGANDHWRKRPMFYGSVVLFETKADLAHAVKRLLAS